MQPWPEITGVALQGLAGDVVLTVGPQSKASPAALLLELLVAFGNAVGPGPHFRVGGVQHPARLFACSVGKTSRARKGQAHYDVRQVLVAADGDWYSAARCSRARQR